MNEVTNIRIKEHPAKDSFIGFVNLVKLAEITGSTERAIKEKLVGFQEEIQAGRYSPYSYIKNQRTVLVNIYAFLDYLLYKDRLEIPSIRKSIPPFNAKEVARICHPLM